jgi:hypothetical protein
VNDYESIENCGYSPISDAGTVQWQKSRAGSNPRAGTKVNTA